MQAELELRESEARYRALAEQSGTFAWEVDADGLYTYVSHVVEPVLGYQPDELVGRMHFYDLHPDEGREAFKAAVFAICAQHESFVALANAADSKDGRRVWLSTNGTPLLNPDGTLRGYRGSNTDISQRRAAEEEILLRGDRLEELLREREHNLALLGRSLASIIRVVGQVVEMRDPYTAGHQRRVSELSVPISEEMGMSAQQIEEIRVAALIHDVGKISVPAEILSKPGALSPLEFSIVKGHAETGYTIITSADLRGPIAEIVYQHHERCDGSGYPRGLTAEQLLPGAKVLMVADVVEAMASHRPYRAALGVDAALAEIERGAGTLYDAEVCKACMTVFHKRGFAFSEGGSGSTE